MEGVPQVPSISTQAEVFHLKFGNPGGQGTGFYSVLSAKRQETVLDPKIDPQTPRGLLSQQGLRGSGPLPPPRVLKTNSAPSFYRLSSSAVRSCSGLLGTPMPHAFSPRALRRRCLAVSGLGPPAELLDGAV